MESLAERARRQLINRRTEDAWCTSGVSLFRSDRVDEMSSSRRTRLDTVLTSEGHANRKYEWLLTLFEGFLCAKANMSIINRVEVTQ